MFQKGGISEQVSKGESMMRRRYFWVLVVILFLCAITGIVAGKPTAQFIGTPVNGQIPLTVQFTDQSGVSGTATYKWDINNDGTTDYTTKNAVHTYTTPGTYSVNLIVRDSSGRDNELKTDYISVTAAPVVPVAPVPAFTSNVQSGYAPLTVQFTDKSTGTTPRTYAWDFGDGGTSSSQSPSHVFTTVGTFDVVLTVTNIAGTNSVTKSGYITVTQAPATTPTITVTAPNGAESWIQGSSHAITWTSTGDVGSNVKIEVLKAGSVVQTLSSSDPNDGTFSWTLATTLVAGTDYRVRITSMTNTAVTDVSNNYFTITTSTPSITVTSPNGGETWNKGTSYPITWSSTGSLGSSVNIALFNGNSFLNYITTNVPIGSGGSGSYTWQIPAGTATGSTYKIGVQSASQTSMYDLSNNDFTITPATTTPSITVTSPNGAESWAPGSNHAITWTSTGDVGSNVKIEVLKAGSVVQTLSSSDPNDGTFSWTLATTLVEGTDYRIRITSTTNTAITDSSNANFAMALVPPQAAFTSNKRSGDAPLVVTFTDQSIGTSPRTYAWDFDNDGVNESTLQNPSFTFDTEGTYTVKLSVTNAIGSDVEIKTGYITVTPPGTSRAGIALTFDDNYVDAWFAARSIFQKYDAHVTFFISNFNSLDQGKIDKLKILQADGHEIAFHGYNHEDVVEYLNSHTLSDYMNNEIIRGINLMKASGFNPVDFAFPYGSDDARATQAMTPYFGHMRDTYYAWDDTIYYEYGSNTPYIAGIGIDDNTYGNTMTDIYNGIARAKSEDRILIFYGHETVASNNPGEYQTSYARLDSILKYVSDNNMKTYTIAEIH